MAILCWAHVRELLDFRSELELVIVNSLPLCEGNFTREQTVLGHQVKTTIDYALVPKIADERIQRMQLLDKGGLDSDHKPITLTMAWSPMVLKKHQATPCTLRRHAKWRTHEMDEAGWQRYENACDRGMADWLAAFELKDESACDPQQIADALVSMVATIDPAAEAEVGKKQVGAMSRPFMGREVASLSRQRRNATGAEIDTRRCCARGAA